MLNELEQACTELKCDVIRERMRTFVDGYKPASEIVDLTWLRRQDRAEHETLQFPSPRIEVTKKSKDQSSDSIDATS